MGDDTSMTREDEIRLALQSCLARAFDAGLDTGLELGRLLGEDVPPDLPDMGLLRKLADGGGGRRTGDLLRRGWIKIEVTEAGIAALAGQVLGSQR